MSADYDDDATFTSAPVTDASSVRVNVMRSPVAKLTYGAEFSTATVEREGGDEASMNRIYFTTKYAFRFLKRSIANQEPGICRAFYISLVKMFTPARDGRIERPSSHLHSTDK